MITYLDIRNSYSKFSLTNVITTVTLGNELLCIDVGI